MDRESETVLSSSSSFLIGIAAQLISMHPNTLRKYEEAGLVVPERNKTSRRMYSAADVEKLRKIKILVDTHGLNLHATKLVLDLLEAIDSALNLLENDSDLSKCAILTASWNLRRAVESLYYD